ncbi:MerR family transcriptional regulator [Pukyongiella litopenaei]|uniref:MerR family transcriptional regulator n=1 Tax=Pukyongiella litopenaei TaxID=2605946 RepID=A0A2S0MV25_9RHOB|nr:MerR family transcriptional regulator [Pukyongiella litopenaei]AVO39543.1 MerR family transcriptional regulator [Pukyongiella litopenaei]
MNKSPDAFRTISEVADWLGLQAHVLRFWESRFTQVKPVKRAGGRRYYRPADMQLLGGIKKLLHDDGLTIKGVQKIIREQGVAHVSSFSQPLDAVSAPAGGDGNGAALAPLKPARGAPPLPSKSEIPPEPEPEDDDELVTEPVAEPQPAAEPVPDAADEPDAPEVAAPEPIAAQTGDEPAADPEQIAPVPPAPESPESPAPAPTPSTSTAADDRPELPDEETAPEPAAPAEIDALPGALAQVAALDSLTAAQAAEIAPLAQALRQWHDRAVAAGAA